MQPNRCRVAPAKTASASATTSAVRHASTPTGTMSTVSLHILPGRNPWPGIAYDQSTWQTVSTYVRDWTIDGTFEEGTWKGIHDALMEADRERAE